MGSGLKPVMKPFRGGIDIQRLNEDENAVSDIIGFILIFAISIIAISLIMLFAQPVLDKSKDDISFSNMEQAFILLHSDINDIASGKSTIKTRDLNLIDAQLAFNSNSTIITIETELHDPITFNAGSIEYNINELIVSLENGALISNYYNGSFITREPFIFTTNDLDGQITIINLIKLDGSDFSTGGEGIVRIIEQKNFSESYISQQYQNISIKIESPYADGWAHYFEKQGYNTSIQDSTVIANITGTKPRIFGTVIKISQGKAIPVNRPEYSLTAVINTPSEVIDSNLQLNATITNNGNQNMSNVIARLDYFSYNNFSIQGANWTIGDMATGNISVVNWTVSSFSSLNDAEFTVTVEGTGTSSWIHPMQYQVRSNKIWVVRS